MSSPESPKIKGEANASSLPSPSSGNVKNRGGWPKGKKRSKPTPPCNKRSKKSKKKQNGSAAHLNNEASSFSGVSSSGTVDNPIFKDEKMMGLGGSKTFVHGRNSVPIADGKKVRFD